MTNARENEKLQPMKNKSNLSKILKDFCDSTSLHGYGYLYNINGYVFFKIIWVFVILAMTALGHYLFVKHTKEYLNSTILTTIETSSASLSVSMY